MLTIMEIIIELSYNMTIEVVCNSASFRLVSFPQINQIETAIPELIVFFTAYHFHAILGYLEPRTKQNLVSYRLPWLCWGDS